MIGIDSIYFQISEECSTAKSKAFVTSTQHGFLPIGGDHGMRKLARISLWQIAIQLLSNVSSSPPFQNVVFLNYISPRACATNQNSPSIIRWCRQPAQSLNTLTETAGKNPISCYARLAVGKGIQLRLQHLTGELSRCTQDHYKDFNGHKHFYLSHKRSVC